MSVRKYGKETNTIKEREQKLKRLKITTEIEFESLKVKVYWETRSPKES